MNRMKVHRTVEYIKASGEFNYDRIDVLDDIDRILAHYKVTETFTPHEEALLKYELTLLAEARQERECARIAHMQTAP